MSDEGIQNENLFSLWHFFLLLNAFLSHGVPACYYHYTPQLSIWKILFQSERWCCAAATILWSPSLLLMLTLHRRVSSSSFFNTQKNHNGQHFDNFFKNIILMILNVCFLIINILCVVILYNYTHKFLLCTVVIDVSRSLRIR